MKQIFVRRVSSNFIRWDKISIFRRNWFVSGSLISNEPWLKCKVSSLFSNFPLPLISRGRPHPVRTISQVIWIFTVAAVKYLRISNSKLLLKINQHLLLNKGNWYDNSVPFRNDSELKVAHAFFLSVYGIDTPLPKIISFKGDVPRDLSNFKQ